MDNEDFETGRELQDLGERFARAIGVWWTDREPIWATFAVLALGRGRFRVIAGRRKGDVDAATLLVILLGYACGEHVDGRPWDRAVLDAAPKVVTGPVVVQRPTGELGLWGEEPSDGERPTLPGDPASRDALSVHADALQAQGDPLGLLLALWLRDALGDHVDLLRSETLRAIDAAADRSEPAGQ